jgi:hypothetical protein
VYFRVLPPRPRVSSSSDDAEDEDEDELSSSESEALLESDASDDSGVSTLADSRGGVGAV